MFTVYWHFFTGVLGDRSNQQKSLTAATVSQTSWFRFSVTFVRSQGHENTIWKNNRHRLVSSSSHKLASWRHADTTWAPGVTVQLCRRMQSLRINLPQTAVRSLATRPQIIAHKIGEDAWTDSHNLKNMKGHLLSNRNPQNVLKHTLCLKEFTNSH